MKTILPLLLIISMSAGARAQVPYGIPNTGIPANYAGQPGASGINYQGIPAGFQPHPHLSPFANASEQHVNDGGLWYSDTVSHFEERGKPFQYDVSVEWLHSNVRGLGGRVGDPDALTTTQITGTSLLPGSLEFQQYFPPSASRIPDVRMGGIRLQTKVNSREGWSFNLHGIWNEHTSKTFSARQDRDRYRIDEIDAIILEATGTSDPRLQTNLRNTSDLEIAETIILNRPGVASVLGNPTIPIVGTIFFDADNAEFFGIRGNTFDILDRVLLPATNLPLQNGESGQAAAPGIPFIDNPIVGVYQRFDLEFAIRHSVQSFGAGAHFETNPIFQHRGIQFRGLVGGRYMRLNEGFHFRGQDSGLAYTVVIDNLGTLFNRVDDDGDFVVDEVEENGTGGDYAVFNPSLLPVINAFVDNTVESNLGGPEVGLSYDLGRKAGLQLGGSTRLGVMLNRERIRLAGDNIGKFAPNGLPETLNVDPTTGALILDELFDTTIQNGQPTANAFTDSNETKHISPLFEQSITAQVPLFDRVPVLRDMPITQNATLQAGYTFLWIGQIAGPSKSIAWESNPRAGLFPSISPDRSSFYQHTFRLGINCDY